jgi:tetratricopeptide (TPR) repeat protein
VHRQEPRERIARKFLIITHQGRAVALTRLGRPAEALTDWNRAIALDDGPDRDELRLGRAASACRLGSYHEAVALADNLAESESISGATLLQLACVYAQISAAIDGDTALAPAERAGRVESYVDRAIRLLLRARQNEYYRSRAKFRQALRDPDLDPVRSRVAFRLLLLDLGFPADPFVGVE